MMGENLKPARPSFFLFPTQIDIWAITNDHYIMDLQQNNELSTIWIENLAIDEINMNESGVINLHEHLNPVHFLEESSINFMNGLRDKIEYHVGKFNEYRGQQTSSHIKVFKISNTVNDFMLFRNSLRLIIARKSNDVITIGFISNGKDLLAPRLTMNDTNHSLAVHEIKAHIGPFHDISWKFQGEDFDSNTMVKHYLTEFIKQSAG